MQWMTRGSWIAGTVFALAGCGGTVTSFALFDEGGLPSDDGGSSPEAGNPGAGSSSGSPSGSSGSSSSGGGPSGSSSSSGGGGPSSSSGGGSSGGGSSSSGSSGGRDAGADATTTVRYSTTIGPILDNNCTNVCHGGCGGLSISYANIVNVKSGEVTSLNYVTPNDPGHSYLFCKVSPNDVTCTSAGTTITGSKMPPGGNLSAANLASIKTWIQGGAPN
jgi:hypothetical protein